MGSPRRIDLSLFDKDVREMIESGISIIPITQEMVDGGLNPNNIVYGRVGRNIYMWLDDAWGYIIADDIDIDWSDVKNKPIEYKPIAHTHSELHSHINKNVLDGITEPMVGAWNTVDSKADKAYVDLELEGKSGVSHNHDTVYSKLNHTHDFYTKSIIDERMLLKSDVGHDHDGAYWNKSTPLPRGEKGDKPLHKWVGTTLAFENPNGSMGLAVELKGEKGLAGEKGEQGNAGAIASPTPPTNPDTVIWVDTEDNYVGADVRDLQTELAEHKLDYIDLVGKVMSYDDYFMLAVKDANTTYTLDKTTEIAKAKKILNQTPSLIISKNKVISDKLPIQEGLKIWVDSKYKNNTDISKATYNDLSGNNKNGVIQGVAFDEVSGWNDGLNFDGVDDKVLFEVGEGTNGLSFELIFLWEDSIINSPRYTKLISSNSDYLSFYKAIDLVLKFSTKTRPTIPSTMLEYNKDNHVVGTVDFITGDIKLYLNGVLVSTAVNEPFTHNSITQMYIGSYTDTWAFAGNQKMFRFYDRPLTKEEIKHNYDIEFLAELPETPTEPIEPTPTEPTKEYSIHNSLLMPKKVRFIGHRGLSGLQPENTLPSFAECGIKGIWGAETDIRVTSDGQFVCMHDVNVDRTTDGTGNVADLTLDQIKAMTIDYGNNIGNHIDLKVPTLEEMLIECSKYGVVPILHLYIDTVYIEELVNRVNKLGFESTVIYTCTSPTQLNLISSLTDGKSLTFGLGGSTSDLSVIAEPVRSNQGRYLNYNAYNNYPNSIDEIHLTKQVAMCFVINDLETAKDFINRGIDGIATDILFSLE